MLTKPNILRLITFTLFFAAALYYPVREVLSYERPQTPPREYRYRIAEASLNDFELRPRVSGRWKWVEYIFPRTEKQNKLRLDLLPSRDESAPALNYVYYPMSREMAKETMPRVARGTAELVIKSYPNGRWSIGELFIDGKPVQEPKVGVK